MIDDCFRIIRIRNIKYKTLGKVFICEDFSGRTSSDDDFICVDNHNGEGVPQVDISELPRRFNSDHVLDQNGRRLFGAVPSQRIFIG